MRHRSQAILATRHVLRRTIVKTVAGQHRRCRRYGSRESAVVVSDGSRQAKKGVQSEKIMIHMYVIIINRF